MQFGTDGIRGVANEELTPELALQLGLAAAEVLGVPGQPFLIGRDTRRSGTMLSAALAAGLASGGYEAIDVGVLPTPGVAYLSATRSCPAAVISASHNAFGDNGIKFFSPGGKKLSDDTESKLEKLLHGPVAEPRKAGDKVGQYVREPGAREAYSQHLISSFHGETLGDLKIVIDCANGANSEVAPAVLLSLQAQLTILNDQPDGININANCGSTHPEQLQETVKRLGADVGFAFDGDADRMLAVDNTGALIDGDHILAVLALDAKQSGHLKDNTLVITVMANLGLKLAMEDAGVEVFETPVGDRYVLEALDAHGWSLGGEQSGHVIIPEYATTGDGLLTALQVLAVMKRTGKSLNELSSVVTKLPQVLKNVRVKNRDALASASRVWAEVDKAQAELGKTGRVLLRTSGTEPLVRVMVEAPTHEIAKSICNRLCEVVEIELVN